MTTALRHRALPRNGSVAAALLLLLSVLVPPALAQAVDDDSADDPRTTLPMAPSAEAGPPAPEAGATAGVPAEEAAEAEPGGPGAGDPVELLVQGNAFYEEERYEEAAEAYRTALAYGIENEILHYNLANALFRMGRLGPSIVEYERALRLAPGDADIRANLEFARAYAPDAVPPEAEGPVAILLQWLGRPSVNGSAAVALLAYLAGATLLGMALLRRRAARGNLLWGLAVAALLLAIPPSLVVATQGAAREWDDRAVVLAERVDCRSGPTESSPVLFTVHEGTTVEVLDRRPAWSRVTLPDGLNGWVPDQTIQAVAPPSR